MSHDSVLIVSKVKNDTELLWLKEKAQYSELSYHNAKDKFEDPNSKVFKNVWYKEKYVVPAWEAYSQDKNLLLKKINQLSESEKSNTDSFLKILFRLGLVFLCMVSIHNFLRNLDFKKIDIGSLVLHKKRC